MSDQPTATMFSKRDCPYCDEARAFLAANDLPCVEVKLDNAADRAAMYNRFGLTGSARTVPQIVITADGEDFRIGGAQELRISGIKSLFVDIKDLTTVRPAVSFEVSRDFVGVLAIEGHSCCE
jgi:glutaredoxin